MRYLLTTAGAAALLGAVVLAGAPAIAGPGHDDTAGANPVKIARATDQPSGHMTGSGTMGRGMMGQGMHGQGMHGQGMQGQGMHGMMMGYRGHMGMGSGLAEKDLTADAVKKIIEGRLAWNGRDRLKVGTVTKKDDDTYVVEIVTLEDSLVERLEVDRKTGFSHRIR